MRAQTGHPLFVVSSCSTLQAVGWQAILDALGVASFLFCTGGDSADARVEWESTSRCGVETGTSSLGNGRQVDVYISQSLAGARLIHRCAATETRLFCFTCQAICCFLLKRFSRAPNLAPLATCKATDRAASNHEVGVFEVHGRYVCHSL